MLRPWHGAKRGAPIPSHRIAGRSGAIFRSPVLRLVRAPGDARAVVLLGAAARGTELVLDLVRAADELSGAPATRTETLRVALDNAPWEVED